MAELLVMDGGSSHGVASSSSVDAWVVFWVHFCLSRVIPRNPTWIILLIFLPWSPLGWVGVDGGRRKQIKNRIGDFSICRAQRKERGAACAADIAGTPEELGGGGSQHSALPLGLVSGVRIELLASKPRLLLKSCQLWSMAMIDTALKSNLCKPSTFKK